jgi:hypothetical protein
MFRYISTEDLLAWKLHIYAQKIKQQPIFNQNDINNLSKIIQKWKKAMKNSFKNAEKKEGINFTFNYPNFESENHWNTLIPFLGPPIYQSTIHWENFHADMKHREAATNHKQTRRDAMISVTFFPEFSDSKNSGTKNRHKYNNYNTQQISVTSKLSVDFTPSNRRPMENWNSHHNDKKTILHMYSILGITVTNIDWTTVVPFTGFHLNNNIVPANGKAVLKIQSPLRKKCQFVLLERIFSLATEKNSTREVWLCVKKMKRVFDKTTIDLPAFEIQNSKLFLPLQNFGYVVLKWVSMVTFPFEPKYYFYNFWIWDEIGPVTGEKDDEEWNEMAEYLESVQVEYDSDEETDKETDEEADEETDEEVDEKTDEEIDEETNEETDKEYEESNESEFETTNISDEETEEIQVEFFYYNF